MSLSTWGKNATNCYLNVITGTTTYSRIPYVEGDIKISGLQRICNEIVRATARGGTLGVGYGDPTFPQITLSEKVTQLIASAAPGPAHDILLGVGAYASDVSMFGSGKPFCVDLEFVEKGAAYGDPDDTMRLYRVMFPGYDFAQGTPNTRSWTGTVEGVPGYWGNSVGGAGTVASVNGLILARRIDQDGN